MSEHECLHEGDWGEQRKVNQAIEAHMKANEKASVKNVLAVLIPVIALLAIFVTLFLSITGGVRADFASDQAYQDQRISDLAEEIRTSGDLVKENNAILNRIERKLQKGK